MLISKYNEIRLRSDRHPKKNVKENFFVIIFLMKEIMKICPLPITTCKRKNEAPPPTPS